jgi:hypothetical protein
VAWLLEVRLRPVQLEHYTAASACSSSSSSRQQQAGRIAAQQWLAAGCAGRPPIVPWTPGVRTGTHAQPAWTDTAALLYRKSQDPQAPRHTQRVSLCGLVA